MNDVGVLRDPGKGQRKAVIVKVYHEVALTVEIHCQHILPIYTCQLILPIYTYKAPGKVPVVCIPHNNL